MIFLIFNALYKKSGVRRTKYSSDTVFLYPVLTYMYYNFSRRLLQTTLTLLSAMAAPASMGESWKPKAG